MRWRPGRSTVLAGCLAVGLVLAGCSAQPRLVDDPQKDPPMAVPSQGPEAPPGEPSPDPKNQPSPEEAAEQTCPSGGGGGGGPASKASYQGEGNQAPMFGSVSDSEAKASAKRPVVKLCFEVSKDRSSVEGREIITFTPDQKICEMVFRAWPNKPATAKAGNRLTMGEIQVDGEKVKPTVQAAGAPAGVPGTLLTVPVKGCVEAGKPVKATLDFSLKLGENTPERVGYSGQDQMAWFASAYPLLAWEKGRGWAKEPAVDLYGESATSEAFKLDSLEVIAPKGDEVAAVGKRVSKTAGQEEGTTLYTFQADAVRDVAVTVGQLETKQQTTSGVRIHLATAKSGTNYPPADWMDEVSTNMVRLLAYFDEFPYDDLWVTVIPGFRSGIEFPGAVFYGDVDPVLQTDLVSHELAHQWFYGLVGNNQGRDPWLDESFAAYGEALASNQLTSRRYYTAPSEVREQVGESMAWYAKLDDPDLYSAGIYDQGAAMLLEARTAAGPDRWDRLLKRFIARHSHQIVTDEDIARMVEDVPGAAHVLRRYGAID